MMPKQIEDMSQDPMTIKDAIAYTHTVVERLKVKDVESAIQRAYLMGAKSGYCVGYHCGEIETDKAYSDTINWYKEQINHEK